MLRLISVGIEFRIGEGVGLTSQVRSICGCEVWDQSIKRRATTKGGTKHDELSEFDF